MLYAALHAAGSAAMVPSPRPPASLPPLAGAPADAADAFERGKTAFARGEYRRAIAALRPLLHPDILLDTEADVVQAYRLLGIAYLFEGDTGAAKEELKRLLELRPDYRLDPLLDPPTVVDFFNQVVREQEAEIARLEAHRRRQAPPEAPPTAPAERVMIRHTYNIAFVPFGAGQFQNGDHRKGWLFLGGELALGAASVGALVANFALYGFHPQRGCLAPAPATPPALPTGCPANEIDHHDENVSHDLLRVQLATGVLFFGVVAWGIFDAVRHFQPLIPADEAAARPPSSPSPALSLGPAGLVLRF